ncbi:hypothetical protein D3C81_1735700 [compost metagenome]
MLIRRAFALGPPAPQHLQIAGNRGAVEANQCPWEICVAQAGLRHVLLGDVADEVVEPPAVIEQGIALEAEPGQVLEQQALLGGCLVQARVGRLPTAGAQYTDGRRPAVGSG